MIADNTAESAVSGQEVLDTTGGGQSRSQCLARTWIVWSSDRGDFLLTLIHELLPPEFHIATASGWGKMFGRLDETLG